MQTILYLIGKTNPYELNLMVEDFKKRIEKYHRFEILTIPDFKNRRKLSQSLRKQKEGEVVLKRIKENDYLVLLDEDGKQINSSGYVAHTKSKQDGTIRTLKQIADLIGHDQNTNLKVYARFQTKDLEKTSDLAEIA